MENKMSYELADGSKSTDYKIGDEFTHENGDRATFSKDDGTGNPWFTDRGYPKWTISWCFLTPVKTKKHASVINQLRETIKQLEATIQELEQ
jgi:hypothetical protein